MSYEKKMKDLMARLVSMSPEPPPFPEEEAPMARQREQRKSRPALVFAAAAVLVVLLAVPLLLFSGDGDPGPAATSTTTTAPVTSTSEAATTTTVIETTTTVPGSTTTEPIEGTVWTGVVYLYQEPANSFQGNPAVVPIVLEVTADPGTFSDHTEFTGVLTLLAENGIDLPEPFRNAIPSDVRVVEWGEENGVVRPDMNEAFLEGAGGLLADMTMLNQIIYSLTWMNADASVLFTVNGEPVEDFGSEGLDLTTPVGREDFREHLHSINLTSPVIEQDGRYLVEGLANVFEATVNIEVLDAEGSAVHEEFVTATCGTGCWGEFSTEIDAELIVPGESSIRVFTSSAEDGSPVDVVTVPIPEGGVWQLNVGG